MLTTCIGAFPKPDYITIGNWKETIANSTDTSREFTYTDDNAGTVSDQLLDRATAEAIEDQVFCGVDVPTDGEQRRENYIHYHCRHLSGIDFVKLTDKVHRNGAAVAPLPSIVSPIKSTQRHFLHQDFKVAQSFTNKPIKITVPGPLTIMDTTANIHYADDKQLAFDLADALNHEIRHLAESGCRHIQLDEPLFARKVSQALDYGVECLDRCFYRVPNGVTRIMHMCCGYPGHLDDESYLKADPDSYFQLARALDSSSIHQISIEDAHCLNDLSLLELFQHTSIIFGVIAVASSKVESVKQIRDRLLEACDHIDSDRLIAAPDCGLMMFDRAMAMEKLANLCEAAHSL